MCVNQRMICLGQWKKALRSKYGLSKKNIKIRGVTEMYCGITGQGSMEVNYILKS